MNVETDVMHIAMKKAISSRFVAVTSHTSVTCKFGFFFIHLYPNTDLLMKNPGPSFSKGTNDFEI